MKCKLSIMDLFEPEISFLRFYLTEIDNTGGIAALLLKPEWFFSLILT